MHKSLLPVCMQIIIVHETGIIANQIMQIKKRNEIWKYSKGANYCCDIGSKMQLLGKRADISMS